MTGAPIDLPRLHRFLVIAQKNYAERSKINLGRESCVWCHQFFYGREDDHAPDCEWVALVAMTAPRESISGTVVISEKP